MLDALNIKPDWKPTTILANVKQATDELVGNASQFDDLTMLAITLK
ncbi:MAG: hypothetical protein J6P57_09960 [Lachnospiraceae bacterium]|nr:hypothetical protein [Lachnospiraceae bacterium]